ncbi:MAG: hypothetical protein BGN99_10235 [Alphaproteobacteria bacterium 65-37]|jgi:hypothetical protein|nr:MAG: hypothetical protein BGN99_10235 [Alphaproteobacteria bacterium 65-37]
MTSTVRARPAANDSAAVTQAVVAMGFRHRAFDSIPVEGTILWPPESDVVTAGEDATSRQLPTQSCAQM